MFDEGNSCKDEELTLASKRFHTIIQVLGTDVMGDGVGVEVGGGGGGVAGQRPLLMTLGNHDVGLGWQARKEKIERAVSCSRPRQETIRSNNVRLVLLARNKCKGCYAMEGDE